MAPTVRHPIALVIGSLAAAATLAIGAAPPPSNASASDADAPPRVEAVADSVIDPAALTFERGAYGTAINGQTFQYPAITTHAGWQYATWFDGERRLCVGRRELPDGDWRKIAFDDYHIGDHNDVHNVAVIGVCPLDGSIHLAFDHHGSPLHYRVSKPGAATEPHSVEWTAALFGPTTSQLVEGRPIRGVTYPEFFTAPDGRLQLYYRIGGSGSGDSWLAEYDPRPGNGGWSVHGVFVERGGSYRDSTSRNAYHNGFDYDASGRLHITWTWREGRDNGKWGLLNCHDLMYAYSDDAGRTWRNNGGDVIAVTGRSPMHVASPGVTVRTLPYRWGMMNQVTQTVDQRGRVHVVMWQQPPDAPQASRDMDTWAYFHYWRDTDGGWHERRLPFAGRKPTLHADARGDLVLVFNKGESASYHGRDLGGRLHVATASEADGWEDWRIVWSSDQRFIGEPRIDAARWAADATLSVYVQEHPAEPGRPSPLHAIDLRLAPSQEAQP